MGVEPDFSRATAVWPPALAGRIPAHTRAPSSLLPDGLLEKGAREAIEASALGDQHAVLRHVPVEPLWPTIANGVVRQNKWTLAIVASLVFHAAIAWFLLGEDRDLLLIEGSENAGVTMLGNASEDQVSAGDIRLDATNVTLIEMTEPRPVETVAAEAVPAETAVTPVVEAVGPQTPVVASTTPEILAVQEIAPPEDERAVAKPADSVDVEAATAMHEEPENPVKKPESKLVDKPANNNKPKPAEKKLVTKAEVSKKAGSGGAGQGDSKRGAADGEANGTTAAKGKNGSQSTSGNAAVSNYPGKVQSKLQRALRPVGRGLKGEVHVAFHVSADGSAGDVRIAQSSGEPALDKAAMDTVRRASPFPPIPEDAARSSWDFTVPLAFVR